jgi:diguanylate cyclase (GGDEF)-like protein
MIDIDQFKRVNDRFGHLRGDEVLKTLCEACKAQLRESDLLARLGGDEFVVLLAETDLNGAQIVAEGLRRIMAEVSVTSEGADIRWTVSIGVATLTTDDASIEDCLKRADQALYRAKSAGRNQIETG